MSIIKKGSKYLVISKRSGRTLGTHPTRTAAIRQLGAIEANKARKGLPRRRPKEHKRRIRTFRGKRTITINRGIRKKSVQIQLHPSIKKAKLKVLAEQRANALIDEFIPNPTKYDEAMILHPRMRRIKKKSSLTSPKGSAFTRTEKKTYNNIIKKARMKGYKIPKLNLKRGPVIIDEINIPETSQTEAFLLPDKNAVTNKDTYLLYLDDDATKTDKKKALAHELGHINMYEKNFPSKKHTENNADKIAANILNTTIKDIRNTDHQRDNLTRIKKKTTH